MTEPDKNDVLSGDEAMWMATTRALISLGTASKLSNIALESLSRGDKIPDEFFADLKQQHEKIASQIDRLITALTDKYGDK